MKPGYYWIKRRDGSVPEVAWLSKSSGWRFFDGSHHKLIRQNVIVISRVEEPAKETT